MLGRTTAAATSSELTPPTRAKTLAQSGSSSAAVSIPRKKRPNPSAATPASPIAVRLAERHSGSGSRATSTTPTIPSAIPASCTGRRFLALEQAADDGDEDAQRPDRRDDADRAERHRPVEAAERDDAGDAGRSADRRLLRGQLVAPERERDHHRQDEADRLAHEQHRERRDAAALKPAEEVGDAPGDAGEQSERYAEQWLSRPRAPPRLGFASTRITDGSRTRTRVHSPAGSTQASPRVTCQ